MPIRPENRARYPTDWPAISRRIRFERAGNRCEMEGCGAENGQPHPLTGSKVVLTVAHLNHDPSNCSDDNLKALCQRCHLRYDAKLHAMNASRTRRLGLRNGELFSEP
jgi:5-methylcytosine-specific restriction endonuclease McrA